MCIYFTIFVMQKGADELKSLLNNDRIIACLNNKSAYGSKERSFKWSDIFKYAVKFFEKVSNLLEPIKRCQKLSCKI